MSVNVNTSDKLFLRTQKQIYERILPVTIVVGILLIVGLIGNILTVVFYRNHTKRTVSSLLIQYTASADATTCVFGFPLIYEKIQNIGYTLDILCTLTQFGIMCSGALSLLLSWTIAIDRYRKICRPFGWQIAVSKIKYIGSSLVVFTLFWSARLLATHKIVKVNFTLPYENASIQTFYCSSDTDDGIIKQIGLAFYFVDCFIFMVVQITFFITYSKIIYDLYRRRQAMNKWKLTTINICKNVDMKPCPLKTDVSNIEVKDNFPDRDSGINTTESDSADNQETRQQGISTISQTNIVQSTTRGFQKFTTAKNPSETKLTLMMFTVTVSYILCHTPYLFIRVVIRSVLNTDIEYNFDSALQFILMLPLLNNVFNPLIYFIFNPKLRQHILSFFKT
jgi:hypothetical protein